MDEGVCSGEALDYPGLTTFTVSIPTDLLASGDSASILSALEALLSGLGAVVVGNLENLVDGGNVTQFRLQLATDASTEASVARVSASAVQTELRKINPDIVVGSSALVASAAGPRFDYLLSLSVPTSTPDEISAITSQIWSTFRANGAIVSISRTLYDAENERFQIVFSSATDKVGTGIFLHAVSYVQEVYETGDLMFYDYPFLLPLTGAVCYDGAYPVYLQAGSAFTLMETIESTEHRLSSDNSYFDVLWGPNLDEFVGSSKFYGTFYDSTADTMRVACPVSVCDLSVKNEKCDRFFGVTPAPSTSKLSSKATIAIIGTVLGVSMAMGLLFFVIWHRRRRSEHTDAEALVYSLRTNF